MRPHDISHAEKRFLKENGRQSISIGRAKQEEERERIEARNGGWEEEIERIICYASKQEGISPFAHAFSPLTASIYSSGERRRRQEHMGVWERSKARRSGNDHRGMYLIRGCK